MKRPMSPEEIAEYIHEEHTPYSKLSFEDAKKRLAGMIQEYADWYKTPVITVVDFEPEEQIFEIDLKEENEHRDSLK